MAVYQGGCHCGAVRFEVETELTYVAECNCSICTKKGALHHRVAADRFRLLQGEEALTLYQFGTRTARHYFCKHCGIAPYGNPRLDPESISINIRCLDGIDVDSLEIQRIPFDGRNWEQAAAKLARERR